MVLYAVLVGLDSSVFHFLIVYVLGVGLGQMWMVV